MKKIIFSILFLAIIGVLVRLFFGVYTHDEFCYDSVFIKHRPTWHWYFYSPIGLSDMKMEDLSDEHKTEQKYWNEFVVGKVSL